MDKEDREVIDQMLRVDHAGQWVARQICEGQLAVLRSTLDGPQLELRLSEKREHVDKLKELLPEYRVRPTALLPVLGAASYALGVGSAALGSRTAQAVATALDTVRLHLTPHA
ncbi:hypothetical protein CYMTET_15118 [Cymbomonas tetramitiformis]|uniref:Uncharacterized protein n=1 Tax=Cymbomonas tetramitiformis TaxID=36881 RepID=A0AAE0L988_9CHLO|nr:hypothetical protein CYMTET_15118 [Cymbomonas tetramitiformis]